MSLGPRRLETGLARLTLGALVIYVPAETWFSWSDGLWHPFYLVDFIAMVLMLVGALASLRARPEPAPELLCVAYAWAACNGWRASWWRILALRDGGEGLREGAAEVWVVSVASAGALACFVLALFLVRRAR